MGEYRMPRMEEHIEQDVSIINSIFHDHLSDRDQSGTTEIYNGSVELDMFMHRYGEVLAVRLVDGELADNDLDDEGVRVAYRTVCFVHHLYGVVLAHNHLVSSEAIDRIPDNLVEAHDYLHDISDTYMQHNPSFDRFIGAFMHELDPSGRYAHIADKIAGVVGAQLQDDVDVRQLLREFDEWYDGAGAA